MLDFYRERFCSGCGACADICPVGAIVMEADERGFPFPAIDGGKCVGCGKCDAVCPYLNAEASRKEAPPEDSCWLYACPDAEVKTHSSSGGAFYAIARAMMEQGAYVAGCAWDDALRAAHTLGRTEQDLQSMQGSKYVQSDTRNIYRSVLEKLEEGETVVFSGAPCQAVAMDRFLRSKNKERYRERLINLAVICHGVSSPMAWETYKQWLESREKSALTGVNFRDKSIDGYRTSWCSYRFANGASTYLPTYLPSFLHHGASRRKKGDVPRPGANYTEATLVYNLALRESCANCAAKGPNAAIDILLGDWYAAYKGEGSMGTSCVIALTPLGARVVRECLPGARPLAYSDIVRENSLIASSAFLGKNRLRFLDAIRADYRNWALAESLYPPKYRLKKPLIRFHLYGVLKGAQTLRKALRSKRK